MPADVRRRLRERGLRIRWYLTALVTVPLLGLVTFAVMETDAELGRARAASRVEQLVRSATAVANARARVQEELLPALTRSFFKAPELWSDLSTQGLSMAAVGVSDAQIRGLRHRTDLAIAVLTKDAATAKAARTARSILRTARGDLDAPARMAKGWLRMADVIAPLDAAELDRLRRARSLGVDRATSRRLADVDLVAAVSRTQDLSIPDVLADRFATKEMRPATWLTLHQDWGSALGAMNAVRSDADPDVVKAVDAVEGQASGSVLDEAIAEYTADRHAMSLFELGLLYRTSQQRSSAMLKVLSGLTGAALAAGAAQHTDAVHRALLIGAALLLLLTLSLGIMIAVRRALSGPLRTLSAQAKQVSRGELVPVTIRGPREVRTVARGLSSAVDNLRNVAAQATAVAAGNLESDIVRQPLPGDLGAVMHRSVSAIIDAIHERDAAQSDLAHRATHDALTELPNRGQAMTFIRRALHRARRSGAMTGLMFIDLDHFKHVNDNLGHTAGDSVLQACAQRMLSHLRAGDSVFRLGGDEFVMLLEDVQREEDAVRLAERLIDTISLPIHLGDNVATVGASIGIAFSQDGSVDAERLLRDADAAAYRAKQSGRGRVGIFDDELREALSERAALETALVQAMGNGELVLHYQPIVQLETGRTIGVEALMRWNRSGRGLLPPSEFIPAAEASALINELGRWALREAAGQLARWDVQGLTGPDFSVAVNISGRHLFSTHLVDDVRSALETAGIAAHRLTVELTETVLVDDPVANRNLHRLRELGVGIAIDDFGTGYTSIGQLPKLPIDKLKIDRSFIASTDPANAQLVQLIVAAAHAFGISVVAEGIELVEQADSLDRLGVDSGQGFYFARPQPPHTPGLLADQDRSGRAQNRPAGNPGPSRPHTPVPHRGRTGSRSTPSTS